MPVQHVALGGGGREVDLWVGQAWEVLGCLHLWAWKCQILLRRPWPDDAFSLDDLKAEGCP